MSQIHKQNGVSRKRLCRRLFIQMSGAPGSGKTTTAELLAPRIDAIAIPHDMIKSQLLDSGISFKDAGKMAYDMDWALAENAIRQGLSVIVDTPCYFPEIIDRGRELACKYDYAYWYVELSADPNDLTVLDARLRTRPNPLRAQRVSVDAEPVDANGACLSEAIPNARERFRFMVGNPCRPDANVIKLDAYSGLEGRVEYILGRISAVNCC